MRVFRAEHPDGAGPGVFGDGVEMVRWRAFAEPPPETDAEDVREQLRAEADAEIARAEPPEIGWHEVELTAEPPRIDVGRGSSTPRSTSPRCAAGSRTSAAIRTPSRRASRRGRRFPS